MPATPMRCDQAALPEWLQRIGLAGEFFTLVATVRR
jgi:hypothetical protein